MRTIRWKKYTNPRKKQLLGVLGEMYKIDVRLLRILSTVISRF